MSKKFESTDALGNYYESKISYEGVDYPSVAAAYSVVGENIKDVRILKKLLKIKFADPKLGQKLWETGDKLLIHISETDLFLGYREKDGKGSNVLGTLLMELRGELDGKGLPTISHREKFPIKDWDIEFQNEEEKDSYLQICVMLLIKDASVESKIDKVNNRRAALYNLLKETNLCLFPMIENLCLIWDDLAGTIPQVMWKYWSVLQKHLGYRISRARLSQEYGVKRILKAEGRTKEVTTFFIGNNSYGDVEMIGYDPDLVQGVDLTFVPIGEFAKVWAYYLSKQFDKLTALQTSKLVHLLAPTHTKVIAEDFDSGIMIDWGTDGTGNIFFNFSKGSVEARQKRVAFNKVTTVRGVSSKFTLFSLCMALTNPEIKANNVLNRLQNLWQRDSSYGLKWEENHPTRLIRDNLQLPIDWALETDEGEVKRSVMDFPYMAPVNVRLQSSQILKMIVDPDFRFSPYTDKYNMKSLAGGDAGFAALTGVYYHPDIREAFIKIDNGAEIVPLFKELYYPNEDWEFYAAIGKVLLGAHPIFQLIVDHGLMRTANDRKGTKILSRAQQGANFNECLATLRNDLDGYFAERQAMPLKITLDPFDGTWTEV